MRKAFLAVLFLVIGLSLVVGYSSSASAQTINMKYSSFFPAPHKNSQLSEAWCKEVEKRTNGKVKFTYFPGATLTPAAQTYDSVVKGIADVGMSVLGYTRGKFPLTAGIDLPLGYKSGYVATKMINEYFKTFKPKEFDEVQVMYLSAHGPGLLNAKKPVSKLEDVKGLKIRSHGFSAATVQALGGAPVGMPMTETYDALSKGVADGVMCPAEAMKGWKLAEVCPTTTQNFGSAYTTGFFVVMNKNKWNALPADVKKTIEKINEEYIEKQGRIWDDIDKEGYDLLKAKGNKIIALSPEEDARWAKAVQPVLDNYIADTKKRGLPGDKVLAWIKDYLKKNDKKPF